MSKRNGQCGAPLARIAWCALKELRDGREGTVHVEDVLEYNQDPDHLRDQLLYRLTLEAQKRIAASIWSCARRAPSQPGRPA